MIVLFDIGFGTDYVRLVQIVMLYLGLGDIIDLIQVGWHHVIVLFDSGWLASCYVGIRFANGADIGRGKKV